LTYLHEKQHRQYAIAYGEHSHAHDGTAFAEESDLALDDEE
jgi:hypothetical protein